jgi:hypothetical protein
MRSAGRRAGAAHLPPRDGQKLGRGPRANPDESPSADLVNAFLNEKDGQTLQSVPVAAFFTKDMRCLYRHIEFPAIYHKERLYTADRFLRDWSALQQSSFFLMWASATVDEILSALHEGMVVGSLA